MKMKWNKLIILLVLGTTFMNSCTTPPMSKETYLEKYNNFLSKTEKEGESYSANEWESNKEEFIKFKEDWKEKFKDEFTFKDELILLKNETKYFMMSNKGEAIDVFNLLKKDAKELKEQLKKYVDNNMEEDIQFIEKQAKELGDNAEETIKELLDEIKLELEK